MAPFGHHLFRVHFASVGVATTVHALRGWALFCLLPDGTAMGRRGPVQLIRAAGFSGPAVAAAVLVEDQQPAADPSADVKQAAPENVSETTRVKAEMAQLRALINAKE